MPSQNPRSSTPQVYVQAPFQNLYWELRMPGRLPLLSSGASSKRDPTILVRGFLRYRLKKNLSRAQTPKNISTLDFPFPRDPSEQLLPQSYRTDLSQIRYSYCSRLQSYCHFTGWANSSSCLKCHAAYHMVALLFSCPTYPRNLAPQVLGIAPL